MSKKPPPDPPELTASEKEIFNQTTCARCNAPVSRSKVKLTYTRVVHLPKAKTELGDCSFG